MGSKPRKILVALGGADNRLHQGVVRYARERGWNLSPQLVSGRPLPWGWKGHGLLTCLGNDRALKRLVLATEVPVVDFSSEPPGLDVPRVIEDCTHAAQLTAGHFLARSFNRFLFYNRTTRWACIHRGEAFAAILKNTGHTCVRLQYDPAQPGGRFRSLMSHLAQSSGPLAVFTGSDDQAVEVLEACEVIGLRVPEDVAIVGGESCLIMPEAMRIPISNVDTGQERVGYEGARLLDDIIQGASPPVSPVLVPAAGLMVRRSSDVLAVNHKGVASCLRLIQERLHEHLTLDDLATVVEVSQRTLHKEFIKHLGCTPGQALRNARIEKAKRLLAEPARYKLGVVASACGYRSANSLCATFSKFVGTTPNSFRKSSLIVYPVEMPAR